MKEWLIAIVPLLSAALGALLTYIFTSRRSREESIIRFKEEKYAKLLVTLKGFIGHTISAQLMTDFFDEQHQAWLYASDDVVRALNTMVRQLVQGQGTPPSEHVGRKLIGEIVLAMRRDLLRRTELDHSAFCYSYVISVAEGADSQLRQMETPAHLALVQGVADGMISVFLRFGAQQRRAPENWHGRAVRVRVHSAFPPMAVLAGLKPGHYTG